MHLKLLSLKYSLGSFCDAYGDITEMGVFTHEVVGGPDSSKDNYTESLFMFT